MSTENKPVSGEKAEEEWISEEELSTEGSSDEGTDKNKQRKVKSKHRKKVFKPIAAASSGADTKPTQPVPDSTENIQWKPKRGSIKLPDVSEDEPTVKHEIWKLSVQRDEVLGEFAALRESLASTKGKVEAGDANGYENEVQCIQSLESELKLYEEELQNSTSERMKLQNEICNRITLLNGRIFERNSSEQFRTMCKCDTKSTTSIKMFKKPTYKTAKKFVNKIQGCKKRKMNSVLINDDEKSRIALLLSDVDTDPSKIYKMTDEETTKIDALNNKLKAFQGNINNKFAKDIQGWNKNFYAERLKQIDESLVKMAHK